MKVKALAFLYVAAAIILLQMPANGDVAPEPGFKRISLNLKLETGEDLSDFRFFIKSGASVQEVIIKSGEQTVVPPLGGGAYYSAGKLLAVPVKELANFGDAQVTSKMTEMQQAVYQGRVPGTIELVDHLFSRTVSYSESESFEDPLYRIHRDPQVGLKAVHVSGGASVSSTPPTLSSGRLFWQSAAAAIVAGIFLVFGITILGILYFRKKEKTL
jgi:hypothetical protein